MNKRELVDAIASEVGDGTSKRDIEDVVDAFVETVGQSVRKGERVSLTGFGTFERRDRAARTGLNPQTGQRIKIRATKVPAFRPGQRLKDVVAGGGGSVTGTKAAKKAGKKAGKTTGKTTGAKKAGAKKSGAKKAAKTTGKTTGAKKAGAKKSGTKAAGSKTTAPAKKAGKKAAGKKAAKKTAKKSAKKVSARKR